MILPLILKKAVAKVTAFRILTKSIFWQKMKKSIFWQKMKKSARQGSKLTAKGAYMDVSDRWLQVRLTL